MGGLHFSYFDAGLTTYAMQDMVVADPMGHLLAGFACLATLVTLVYARPYAGVRDMLKGELFILALFSLLGINVMLSANNFLVIYLGLELMSLSLYALVALRRDHAVSTEAAMKYFVLGALASGFLLYGLSMMYGATGSLSIPEVFNVISKGIPNKAVLVFGTVFVVAGLAFKLAAAPFHMWVPDVYQGAPTAVTLLIAGAPKLAAFAITDAPAGRRHDRPGRGLAADADGAVHHVAADRQPGSHRAEQPEAHAGLLDHRQHGLHAAGHDRGRRQRKHQVGRPTPTARPCSMPSPTC